MNRVARLSKGDRKELFSEAAAQRGLRPTIMEKDFWVCHVLKTLFASPLKDSLVFKGGTSLSKVYRLIDRFSEDIDLVLDWKLLGYEAGIEDDRQKAESKTQQDKFNKLITAKAAEYLNTCLCPNLNVLLGAGDGALTATMDAFRFSRHQHSVPGLILGSLAQSPVRQLALARNSLLADVVAFKGRFYPTAWARYDLARAGTFHLLPATGSHTTELERDYEKMQVMIFGVAPKFHSIVAELQHLEDEINAMKHYPSSLAAGIAK